MTTNLRYKVTVEYGDGEVKSTDDVEWEGREEDGCLHPIVTARLLAEATVGLAAGFAAGKVEDGDRIVKILVEPVYSDAAGPTGEATGLLRGD